MVISIVESLQERLYYTRGILLLLLFYCVALKKEHSNRTYKSVSWSGSKFRNLIVGECLF